MPAKEVADLIAAKRALAKITPDLAKEMNTEIRIALKAIQTTARSLVPDRIHLRNFMEDGLTHKSRTTRAESFPRYNPSQVKRNIVTRMGRQKKNSNGYVGFYSLINNSAAGSIVDKAGRDPNPRPSRSNNPHAREQFIQAVANDTGGKLFEYGRGSAQRGRIIYRAAAMDNGKTKKAILNALNKAMAEFHNQMGKAA